MSRIVVERVESSALPDDVEARYIAWTESAGVSEESLYSAAYDVVIHEHGASRETRAWGDETEQLVQVEVYK